jgi:hypothetical protein
MDFRTMFNNMCKTIQKCVFRGNVLLKTKCFEGKTPPILHVLITFSLQSDFTAGLHAGTQRPEQQQEQEQQQQEKQEQRHA